MYLISKGRYNDPQSVQPRKPLYYTSYCDAFQMTNPIWDNIFCDSGNLNIILIRLESIKADMATATKADTFSENKIKRFKQLSGSSN